MAKKIINLKIDVSKIDKDRLFVGEKGTWLDLVYFYNDEKDTYGNNGLIKQQCTKDERTAKLEMPILGNGSVFVPTGAGNDTVAASPEVAAVAKAALPF